MYRGAEHFGGFISTVAETRHRAGLIVIAPKDGVPTSGVRHAFLPLRKQFFERTDIGRHELPFLPVFVIDLEMMEAEHHRQLMLIRIGITNAVFKRSRRHFADRDHSVNAAVGNQLFQKFVHVPTVGIKTASVALIVVNELFGFADQIDHIEAKTFDALRLPKAQNIFELRADFGIFPIEIGLRHVKQMQVPFLQMRDIFPRVASEFRLPICRRLIGRAIFENVVVDVFLLAFERALKPFVLRRRVIENHIEHQAHALGVRLCDQFFHVRHRAETRIDRSIIGDIVTVIIHRRHEEGR